MANDDSDLIVRLVALNEKTRNAWKDPHNASFYVPASFIASEHREDSSPDSEVDDIELPDSEPEIRLTFKDFPKDISEGFMFGQDKDSCDIYCGCSEALNVSRHVFSITINKKGQVVLKHLTPKTRISVQYGDQEPGIRYLSTWILFPECDEGITIKLAGQLRFRVFVPTHETYPEEYKQACVEYVTNGEDAVRAIPILPTHSQPMTMDPGRMPTPNQKPFYYRCTKKKLGCGNYGKAYLVYDASTGEEYAGKEFKRGQFDYDEGHILASQNHININRIVDFTLEGGPLLVMQYVQGGNLARPWRIKDQDSWSPIEIAGILYQCLTGLAYLHAKPNTIHWNIKPENVLVERRYPRVRGLHVKIGEFGFKEGSEDGQWSYTGPEGFTGGPFGDPLDMWSLGVVVMQMLAAGRLPIPKDRVPQGPTWCGIIENVAVKYALASEQQNRNHPSQARCLFAQLWSFITTHLLKLDPEMRSTAKECLEAGKVTVFKFFQDGIDEDGTGEAATDEEDTAEDGTAEDGTDEDGTDEAVSDEDDNDEDDNDGDEADGQTPDIALLNQHKGRFGGVLMSFMKSEEVIPESDRIFGWDPKVVRY